MVLKSADLSREERLVELLSTGGIAIMPCDTIYGIVGRVPDTEARIRAIKGRGETNPFLMLIESRSAVERLSDVRLDREVAALWPGPLTVVIPAREGGTVAVRVPSDPFLRRLVACVGAPLYSTSVNRSGQPPLGAISEIIREFEESVNVIVDGGDILGREPSTILDVTQRPYRILREGACRIPPSLLR